MEGGGWFWMNDGLVRSMESPDPLLQTGGAVVGSQGGVATPPPPSDDIGANMNMLLTSSPKGNQVPSTSNDREANHPNVNKSPEDEIHQNKNTRAVILEPYQPLID